jgi:hypothetical protein
VTRWLIRLAIVLCLTGAVALGVQAQTLLLYQANPAPGSGVPVLDGLSYAQIEQVTAQVAGQDRAVARAVGFDGKLSTALVPGGYKLRTDPSLVTAIEGQPRQATLLAAAFGYVFHQESVLVLDLDAKEADQFFVRLHFADTALSGPLADAFFQHAAIISPGLGEGYTAFDNDMLFINLRDDVGKPYGGLDDKAFLAALSKAAASFPGVAVSVVKTGRVDARFVANDWRSSPQGGEYRTLLPVETLPALDLIQGQIATVVRQAAPRR